MTDFDLYRSASRPVRLPAGGRNWRHFELAAHLASWGHALAYPQKWDAAGQTRTTIVDNDLRFTVHDMRGGQVGRGRAEFASPHDRGSWGTAIRNSLTGLWEVAWIEPAATMISGYLEQAWWDTEGDETSPLLFDVTGVNVWHPFGALFCTQGNPTVAGGSYPERVAIAKPVLSNFQFPFPEPNRSIIPGGGVTLAIAGWDDSEGEWQLINLIIPNVS